MMVEITERELNAIHETHDTVIRLATLMDGPSGLCAQITNHSTRIRRLEIVVGALIAISALGSGVIGIINLLSG